jgi:hypothetical protein
MHWCIGSEVSNARNLTVTVCIFLVDSLINGAPLFSTAPTESNHNSHSDSRPEYKSGPLPVPTFTSSPTRISFGSSGKSTSSKRRDSTGLIY